MSRLSLLVRRRQQTSRRPFRYLRGHFPALLVLSLMLIAGLLIACGNRRQPQATPTPIPIPIRPVQPTYVVQRGTVVVARTFNGRVQAADEVLLYFRRDGFIKEVYAQKGDVVHKGDLLAALEASHLERELARAQHNLKMAESALEAAKWTLASQILEAQDQLRLAEIHLENAREQARVQLHLAEQELAKLEAQDPAPRKAQAEALLEQARVRLQQAQAAYDAVSWRPDIGALPQSMQLQQATLAYQQTRAAYDLALQAVRTHAVDLRIQEEKVAQARRHLERLEDDAVNTPEEIAVLQSRHRLQVLRQSKNVEEESRVEDARFQVKDIQAQLEETRLRAPISAHVIDISLVPGLRVQAYTPVAVLADPLHLEITAQLVPEDIGLLREGQAVTITLPNHPGLILPGHISQVPYGHEENGIKGQENRTIHIRFDEDPLKSGLRMGDIVEVHVILARRENVLWLPSAAIRTFGGRTFVVVQDGNVRRRVNVTLGLQGKERVEIRSGLKEGQVVIGP